MVSFTHILAKFDYLQKAFKFVINNNNSNSAPYHNLNHLMTVTLGTYRLMKYEDFKENLKMKDMLLAAMFHDFNHSEGKLSDDKNILEAKKGIRQFIEQEKIEADILFIDSILDATQYPYIIESSELNIYQQIIRDADMMQLFENNWIHQCVYGLSQEMNKDFKEFLQMQKKYLDGAKFNTTMGKQLQAEHWDRLIKETELMEKILK
jgi:hypothetical protein